MGSFCTQPTNEDIEPTKKVDPNKVDLIVSKTEPESVIIDYGTCMEGSREKELFDFFDLIDKNHDSRVNY